MFGAAFGVLAYFFGLAAMLPLSRKLSEATKRSNAQSGEHDQSEAKRIMAKMDTLALVDLVLLVAVFSLMVAAAFY